MAEVDAGLEHFLHGHFNHDVLLDVCADEFKKTSVFGYIPHLFYARKNCNPGLQGRDILVKRSNLQEVPV
jgi:hypothetical protein